MKNLLLILFLACGFSLSAQTIPVANPAPADELAVKQLNYDFGKIQQGRPVTHIFEVSNAGKEPLRIENVQASCGCTTPEWSYEPVKPGATSPIKVGYNSAAEGAFSKTVTIVYNGGKTKVITISGIVYKAPATSAPVNSSIALLKQIQ